MRRNPQAFTIVELLVVISIIALLIGILLPALGKARESGRSTVCLSYTRQWGIGMNQYGVDNLQVLPWNGLDMFAGSGTYSSSGPTLGALNTSGAQYRTNMNADLFYGNAIPTLLGQPTYRQMTIDALLNNGTPLPSGGGKNSIWTCPSLGPEVQPYSVGGGPHAMKDSNGATVNVATGQFLFSMVMNSKLDSGTPGPSTGAVVTNVTIPAAPATDATGQTLVRLDNIPIPSTAVLMLEIRAWNTELPANDIINFQGAGGSPYSTVSNNRAKSDWKRFANRHAGGGNVTMVDGSGKFVPYMYATRTTNGDYGRNITTTSATNTFNKADLVWTPFAANSGN